MRITLLISCLLLSQTTFADESDDLCIASGFYVGYEDHFISNMAQHILSARGVYSTDRCVALRVAAAKIGARLRMPGNFPNSDELAYFNSASGFSSRIYSSIAKNAGF